MATLLRSLVLFLFGFAMLLVQSAVAEIVSLHPITPNLLLPIVIFLGVQQDIAIDTAGRLVRQQFGEVRMVDRHPID